MKMTVLYSFNSKEKAAAKAADLKTNGYRLDIFEPDVQMATCDFTDTDGGQCVADGGVWIVAGTKAD